MKILFTALLLTAFTIPTMSQDNDTYVNENFRNQENIKKIQDAKSLAILIKATSISRYLQQLIGTVSQSCCH